LPYDARVNDPDSRGDQSYPDPYQEDTRVKSGFIVDGYPEGVLMRKKPDNRPYYPYHPQSNGYQGYPQDHDGTRQPGEYVLPARDAAMSPMGVVSGNPQDLYAKVIKRSDRDQDMMPRQGRDVDVGRSNLDRGPDVSVGSSASFAQRSDSGRVDERWRPTADAGPMQPLSRDHNYNVSKQFAGVDTSRPTAQPRVYRPGERHIDGTPMFGDPSKDGSRQQMPPLNARPDRLPLPATMRGQYIDDLAAAKTPQTQQDLMQAKVLAEQRHGQPTYFQYPERDTSRQVRCQFHFPVKLLS